MFCSINVACNLTKIKAKMWIKMMTGEFHVTVGTADNVSLLKWPQEG